MDSYGDLIFAVSMEIYNELSEYLPLLILMNIFYMVSNELRE